MHKYSVRFHSIFSIVVIIFMLSLLVLLASCSDVSGNNTGSVSFSVSPDSITVQPPENDADFAYFYGPRKFIAKKPDELVIADDGCYYDEENNLLKNKNRVVTVDLDDELMNITDVNVMFTTQVNGCRYMAKD